MRYILLSCLFTFLIYSANAQSCDCTFDQIKNNQVTPLDTTIGETINVTTTQELRAAIIEVNNTGGNATILIADGTYPIASTDWYPYITASNLVIRSASGNRDAVILTGQGMQDVAPNTEIGLSLVGDNIIVSDLTIASVGNHAISTNSDNHIMHNIKIQDTYEQMIKGTSGGGGSHDCVVQCSKFEYTAGIGPQFYIGGLDIHEGIGWHVRHNLFTDIASPSQSLAEHAIHFWDNSADNIVERNWIINCDRGVGFGLGNSSHEGGIIKNNMIYNNGQDPFHDVGIGLESSPNSLVFNNTVFIAYQNAIEYRFLATTNVTITNNLTNRNIRSRNGGSGSTLNNFDEANASWFLDTDAGDLRQDGTRPEIIDAGSSSVSSEVIMDIDKTPRPQGSGYDIGAHEFILLADLDMDGFTNDVDCDDEDPEINPDAEEIANNDVDENCDGLFLVIDNDMDGFNSDEDCDDDNSDINPDAEEIPNNGVDEDCDGEDLLTSVENLEAFNITVFPNPANDYIKIDFDGSIQEVTIFNSSSKVVKTYHSDIHLNIADLPSGHYFIKIVINEDQYVYQKFVKK